MKKFLNIFVFLLIILQSLNAQFNAKLDSNAMLVGDQMNLTFRAEKQENKTILFPEICDTCINGLEILNRRMDTIIENERQILQQTLLFTAFNEGQYSIDEYTFYDQDSNVLGTSPALAISINTLPIDTAADIKDIKSPLSEPITLKEILYFATWILGGLLIVGIIIFLIYKISKRKNNKPQVIGKPKPTEPAHIIALRDLENIQQQRLWQNGRVKEYYSALSEICRTYIYNRWNISAMEMVNEEIESALISIGLNREIIKNIIQNLQACDLAKFAKNMPLPDENASVYKNMVDFVKNTQEISTSTEK